MKKLSMLVVHICLLSMVGFSLQGCSTEEEAKLKETGSCQGCDLSGVDLEEANLEGADLEGANLSGAVLSGANLRFTFLTGENLEGAILCNTTMPDGTIDNSGCQEEDKK